jgi:hypothetical protein
LTTTIAIALGWLTRVEFAEAWLKQQQLTRS